MDNFRVGGTPTPPPDPGFGPDDAAQSIGKSSIGRAETNRGPSNATTPEHVGVNDLPGPNVQDWLDPPPSGQDVDLGAVMRALHEAGVTLRTAMHEAQQVARDAQVAATKAEAQDIRNSAMLSFGAALAAGVAQIAGGAMDIGGAADAYRTAGFSDEVDDAGTTGPEATTKQNSPSLDTDGYDGDVDESGEAYGDESDVGSGGSPRARDTNGPEGDQEPTEAMEKLLRKSKRSGQDVDQKARFEKADIRLKAWSGLSESTKGLGQIAAGVFELESKQQDAAEKEHEADSLRAGAQSEDADNLLKNIDDLISTTRQTFSQMIDAKNEAMNRITQV